MNKKELKKLLIIFLLSKIIIILYLIINKSFSMLDYYDGELYLTIAEYGYIEEKLYAFFPLYPLLIRLLHIIIPSYRLAGFIISNCCSFGSLVIIDLLTKKVKDNKFNLLCYAFSPILAFISINYTEALYIMLTLLGYYLYKKDKILLSSIVIGLCILTRNSGIILWGAIGIDMLYRFFKKKDFSFKKIVMFGLISLLIGILYPLYTYIKEGNFFLFFTVQNSAWGRESSNLISSIYNDIHQIINMPQYRLNNIIMFIEDWFFYFGALILGIKIFKKDKAASIYVLVALFAFQLSARETNWYTLTSTSLYRYVLGLFPLYIYIFNNKQSYKYKYIITLIVILISLFNCILLYNNFFIG